MLEVLGNAELTATCRAAADRMVNHVPDPNGSKSAGALMVLGGIADAKKMNDELISVDGAHGYSTFLGYYILKAKALAGDIQGALDGMREYWGGMLKMGATSFWEDFNLDWMENAAPIDEIVPEGKVDIHGDWGAYCYIKSPTSAPSASGCIRLLCLWSTESRGKPLCTPPENTLWMAG